MREILFRGKRYDDGSWVEGYLIHDETCNTHIPYIGYLFDGGHDIDVAEIILGTVGQFTGLTDKNGKKIFEGDIIQHGKRKGTIFYYGNFGMFMISWIPNGGANIFMNVLHTEVEVIGNIHDNPELLEVK